MIQKLSTSSHGSYDIGMLTDILNKDIMGTIYKRLGQYSGYYNCDKCKGSTRIGGSWSVDTFLFCKKCYKLYMKLKGNALGKFYKSFFETSIKALEDLLKSISKSSKI